MSWAFLYDISYYLILGLVAFCPIVLFVAASTGNSIKSSRDRVTDELKKFTEIAPGDFVAVVLKVSGVSTVLFVLALIAYSANRIGDAGMLPTSRMFNYFGESRVRWSDESSSDYKAVKFELRELTEVRGDRVQWEETKRGFGAGDVRLFRTISVFSALVLLGGIIGGIRAKGARRRGWGFAAAAFASLFLFSWLWTERESNYIENLVSRYQSEYLKDNGSLPTFPESYPGNKSRSNEAR